MELLWMWDFCVRAIGETNLYIRIRSHRLRSAQKMRKIICIQIGHIRGEFVSSLSSISVYLSFVRWPIERSKWFLSQNEIRDDGWE